MDGNNKKWPYYLYLWLLITMGVIVLLGAVRTLEPQQLDLHFVLIAVITVGIGSRLNVKIQIGRAHV